MLACTVVSSAAYEAFHRTRLWETLAELAPEAAAEWSRRAAETGDPVGEFNYGLALIRGRGVARDEAAGRAMVDRAAAQGLKIAERMRASGYDPDAVTPDADEAKYRPNLF